MFGFAISFKFGAVRVLTNMSKERSKSICGRELVKRERDVYREL